MKSRFGMFATVMAVSFGLDVISCAEVARGELENAFSRGAPAEARHILLQLGDEGVAFLTNRFYSPDYQIASRAVEVCFVTDLLVIPKRKEKIL